MILEWKKQTEKLLGKHNPFPKVHTKGTLLWIKYTSKCDILLKDPLIKQTTVNHFKTKKNQQYYLVFHLKSQQEVQRIFLPQYIKQMIFTYSLYYNKAYTHLESLIKQVDFKDSSDIKTFTKNTPSVINKNTIKAVSSHPQVKKIHQTKGAIATRKDILVQPGIVLPDENKNPQFYKNLLRLLQAIRDNSPLKTLQFQISSTYRSFPKQYQVMLQNRQKSLAQKTPEQREKLLNATEEELNNDKESLVHDYKGDKLTPIMMDYDKILAENIYQDITPLIQQMGDEIEKAYPTKGIPDEDHDEIIRMAFKHSYHNAFDLSITHLKEQVAKDKTITIDELTKLIQKYATCYNFKAGTHGVVKHFHFTYSDSSEKKTL